MSFLTVHFGRNVLLWHLVMHPVGHTVSPNNSPQRFRVILSHAPARFATDGVGNGLGPFRAHGLRNEIHIWLKRLRTCVSAMRQILSWNHVQEARSKEEV